jgi:hypothetical protein
MGRISGLILFVSLLLVTTPASASVYANESAKLITYLTDIKAQILGEITGDPNLYSIFTNAMASIAYDLKQIDAQIMETLSGWTSSGNPSFIDYSEFLASYINSVQKIKADISSILANTYYAEYTQALADQLKFQTKILAEVLKILATT